MNAQICPRCHQTNPPYQAFCAGCGQALAASAAPNFNQPNYQQPFQQPISSAAAPRKKTSIGKILLLVGGVTVFGAVLLVAVIAFAVTRTMIYQVQGKWKLTDTSVNGQPLNLSQLQLTGTTIKFDWNGNLTMTMPNGKSEMAHYEIINNKQIKVVNKSNNQETLWDATIDGDSLSGTTTKNNSRMAVGFARAD